MAGGRPTKYKEEYNQQAYRLALLGLDDSEIASVLDITEATINNWKKEYPAFFESLKDGKAKADAKVSESLYKRATGYDAPDIDIRVIDGQIVKTKLIKHYPPDPTSMIFWLKNRQKSKWRDQIKDNENEDKPVNIIIQTPDGVQYQPLATNEDEIDMTKDERYKRKSE